MLVGVVDEGLGIREEDIGRLFQEFEQLAPVDGDKPQGTGLGLALTRRLVGLHGGVVEVQSEFGKGSQFTTRTSASPSTRGSFLSRSRRWSAGRRRPDACCGVHDKP